MAYLVTGARTVPMSPSLSLFHTLLVPSLSNKLISVSQVTKEVNCAVLIYLAFYLLQDILNKEIIGHDTSCSQTPQQIGIAERKNRHILETAHALLLGTYVPSHH